MIFYLLKKEGCLGICFKQSLFERKLKLQIFFLLTENCNLNCSMCIRGRQQGINMDIDQLQKVLDKNDFSMHDIVITGGEPAIHNGYLEIVKRMADSAKSVTVTSNGTLDLKLEKLVDIDNLFFQISLDGDIKTHNQIRGEKAFERTWKTLERMDALGLRYAVASVVSKKNQNDIFELLPKLEKLKNMEYWRVSYEMPFGNASGIEDIMSAKEWNDFVDHLLACARLRLMVRKIFPFDLYESRKVDLERVAERKRSFNCGSGANKLYVYPDFKVYPCTCLTDFCIGHLDKQLLQDILKGEEIKKFSNYKLQEESECQGCKYKKFCNGGCIGMSYHYFGKLGMGDLRCPKLYKRK